MHVRAPVTFAWPLTTRLLRFGMTDNLRARDRTHKISWRRLDPRDAASREDVWLAGARKAQRVTGADGSSGEDDERQPCRVASTDIERRDAGGRGRASAPFGLRALASASGRPAAWVTQLGGTAAIPLAEDPRCKTIGRGLTRVTTSAASLELYVF